MTLPDAIEAMVARTGDPRYRRLCDPADPEYNPDYVALVLERATTPIVRPTAPPAGVAVDYGSTPTGFRPCCR